MPRVKFIEEWLELPRGASGLPLESLGKAEVLLETLDWVGTRLSEGRRPLGTGSDRRSDLLPARRSVRFGEARARASLRKVGSALKES